MSVEELPGVPAPKPEYVSWSDNVINEPGTHIDGPVKAKLAHNLCKHRADRSRQADKCNAD